MLTQGRLIEERWFKRFGDEMYLMGTHCLDCDKTFFPPKTVCPRCFDGKIEEVRLSKKGTLHTYTQCLMGPHGLEKPFMMGMIDLPERIKLYSLLTGCQYEDLNINMPMEMVIEGIRKDSEDKTIVGYKFRPISKEEQQS